MKILKHKKNIILSLALFFMLFLGIGVTVRVEKASAEITGTIYDYDWANYFNFDSVNITSLADQAGYTTTKNTASQSIICTVSDANLFSSLSYLTIDAIANTSKVDLSVLPDLVEDEYYTFSCSVRSNRDLDLEFNYAVLQIGEFKNGAFQPNIYNSERNQYYGIYSPYNYTSGNIYYRLLMYLDPGDSSFQNGDTIIFENLTVNHGTYIYSYSPYFNSLNNFPNPLPEIVYPPSDDDSSSDISSDDSSWEDEDSSEDILDAYYQGYADGVKFAQYGIFANCQCYIQLNYQYDYERISITDDFFIYGGLNLSKFLSLVEDKTDVLSSFIFFNFANSSSVRPTASSLSFYGTGSESSFIENPWFVTLENTSNSRNLRWSVVPSSTDNNPLYQTEYLDVGVAGSTVVLSFKTPTFSTFDYLRDLTIVMSNNQYSAGYIRGESDGFSNGLQVGLSDNQEAIYNEGHRVGYDDGFAKGYAENNSFLGLFTAAIDAPVLTFTSMLDFEILGYNMKAVVLSLLSAALVVCLIRLFAKGGAT